MKRPIISLILVATLIISCAPAPASPTSPQPATTTQTIPPSEAPAPTQTEIPITTKNNLSLTHIRTPADTDGRQVLTAYWSEDETVIYYALVDEIGETPSWFEIYLGHGQDFQSIQLLPEPKLNYTPFLPVEGLYLEYQGAISPSKNYQFQITRAENHTLFLMDNINQSKLKLLETPDMNFRKAYWMSGENIVFFGIGPEYGTELYLYDIESEKLITSQELIGFENWNLSEWVPSPDGKHIAISDGNQLYVYSTDGSYLTSIQGYHENLRWSGIVRESISITGSNGLPPQILVILNWLPKPRRIYRQYLRLN